MEHIKHIHSPDFTDPMFAFEEPKTKIRYLSLFSGIEAWSCAVKDMPEFEPVAFAEIEPFPCAVLQHHFPDVPNLGDVTQIDGKALRGEVDLIVGGSPCFVAGTMVLTPSGYRPIEDLQVGDEVVSANGNIRKVEATGHKTAPVGKLKILGRPEIVCTPNHPFLCFNVKRDYRRKADTYGQMLPKSKPAFTPAEQSVGMHACRGQWKTVEVPAFPNVKGASTEDIMEMAGWYVGDGYIRRWENRKVEAVVFALVNKRKIQQFKDKFSYAIGAVGKDGKITVCCTAFARWLVENFGEYSYAKRIPYWVYNHPLKDAFLRGYFATDGQDKGTHMRFTTTSQKLALGIADLGRGNVSFDKRPSTHTINGRVVNQRDTYTVQLYTTETPRTKWFFDRWTSIVRSWTPLNDEQTVYNITVEEDHDYIANGFAVHNCQGFSVAGLRKGLDDPRSSLAFAYIRLVEEIQPRYLLFENVPGILSCNHGQDFRSFLSALDDLNYSLAGAVLDSQWFGVPQRRRRMFVVGCAGADWKSASKIFFKSDCLQRNPPSRRKKGEGDSSSPEGCARNCGVSGTLCASGAGLDRPSASGNQLDYLVQDVPAYAVRTSQTGANGIGIDEETAHTLDSSGAEAVAFAQNQRDEVRQMDVVGALAAEPGMKQTTYIAQVEREKVICDETVGALLSRDGKGMSSTIDGKLVAVLKENE